MKNFNERLKKLLKDRGRSQKSLTTSIGMSEAGFVQMINNNSIKVETLEKICHELDVPFSYFLDEEARELEPKDETIWERMVDDLMSEVKNLKMQVYRRDNVLKKNGINFHNVSGYQGVCAA